MNHESNPRYNHPFMHELESWVASTDPDLFEGALIVAKILEPSVDEDKTWEKMVKLAVQAESKSVDEFLDYFRKAGFKGPTEDYDNLNNSRIDLVLEHKQGIPISLGVIMLTAAEMTGFSHAAIDFPGNFLCWIEDRVVDPFTLRENIWEEYAERAFGSEYGHPEDLFVSNKRVVHRMLSNILNFLPWGDLIDKLRINDYLLAMHMGDDFEIYLRRSQIYTDLGDPSSTRMELELALETAPTDQLRTLTKQLIDEFADSSSFKGYH